jgi:predicted XRE-type DNA-binding protein
MLVHLARFLRLEDVLCRRPSRHAVCETGAAGWRVGSAQDFLDLSDAESVMIDIRLALARALRTQRAAQRVSQVRFAEILGSSQSRVAKMEAGDPSVSLDLLVRSLLVAGTSPAAIGRAFRLP